GGGRRPAARVDRPCARGARHRYGPGRRERGPAPAPRLRGRGVDRGGVRGGGRRDAAHLRRRGGERVSQEQRLPDASEVLISTAASLVNLAGIRLTEEE